MGPGYKLYAVCSDPSRIHRRVSLVMWLVLKRSRANAFMDFILARLRERVSLVAFRKKRADHAELGWIAANVSMYAGTG